MTLQELSLPLIVLDPIEGLLTVAVAVVVELVSPTVTRLDLDFAFDLSTLAPHPINLLTASLSFARSPSRSIPIAGDPV